MKWSAMRSASDLELGSGEAATSERRTCRWTPHVCNTRSVQPAIRAEACGCSHEQRAAFRCEAIGLP